MTSFKYEWTIKGSMQNKLKGYLVLMCSQDTRQAPVLSLHETHPVSYLPTRHSTGVVHANVGQNVTPHNPSLGLFLYHFLHTMSLWRHELIHNNTNNQQTPPSWWWSRLSLQRREFNDTMPPKGRASMRMFIPRPLLKDFVWFVKLM